MKTADIFHIFDADLGENLPNFVVDVKGCKSNHFF